MATARTIFLLIALLYWAGCSGVSPTDPAEGTGPVVARYALTAQDGAAPPCCVVDSGNVQVTVVGGALTFRGPAGYADTVFTPAGPASRRVCTASPMAQTSTPSLTSLPSPTARATSSSHATAARTLWS